MPTEETTKASARGSLVLEKSFLSGSRRPMATATWTTLVKGEGPDEVTAETPKGIHPAMLRETP
ncbi:MAG: hypothetical protein OK438_00835 [Thaumarchaeota archaeon]|nr:hypothetical protein [Nitrososphaerota archaeon]